MGRAPFRRKKARCERAFYAKSAIYLAGAFFAGFVDFFFVAMMFLLTKYTVADGATDATLFPNNWTLLHLRAIPNIGVAVQPEEVAHDPRTQISAPIPIIVILNAPFFNAPIVKALAYHFVILFIALFHHVKNQLGCESL